MKRQITIILTLLCFTFQIFAQKGQVSFTAIANAKQIVEGDYFQVDFTLKNADWERFTPPDFTGFQQHGNPSSSQKTTMSNGTWSSSKTLAYQVKAKKVGKYTIGPATAVVNGKEIKSNKIPIEVVKGNPRSNTANTNDFKGQVFVRSEPNATDVKVGQQITLDYKIYTKINVESFDMSEDPEYSGFYAENVRQFSYRWMKEVLNGETYNTKILKRVALYPQQAGLLTIEPVYFRIGVEDPNSNRRRSFFFKELKYLPFTTDSIQINVRPMDGTMPASFSGGVGRYLMLFSVDKNTMTTDDALTLKMTIRGNGDIKRVQPPDLGLGDNFEVYEPRILEEKNFEHNGEILARKIFEYQAIPLKAGQYIIQPKFVYFDTDSLAFVTKTSAAVNLVVKQGQKKIGSTTISKTETPKAEFFPIKQTTSLSSKDSFFFGSPFFWILTILPFVLLGAAFAYRQVLEARGNIDVTLLKSQRAQKVAKQKLAKAEEFLQTNNSKEFYNEVSNASFGYVSDKLNIPPSELSKANIQEKLQSLNVTQQYIDDFTEIIKTCEMALFAGMDNSAAMQETYQKTSEVIVKIEEELLNGES